MRRDNKFPVAILAGGLATRLHPLTETIPKALLPVAGKPFMFHQIDYLKAQGVNTIVMCVGHLGAAIEETIGDGSKFGIEIRYSYDGTALLGTGGAIRHALPLLAESFFVLYGDSYLQIDFRRVAAEFVRSSLPALLTVYRNNNQWDTSNVHFVDGRILAYNKRLSTSRMRYIDYGLSVWRASTLAARPEDIPLDLADIMSELALRGDLAGYEATARFYEIGSHRGLSELDRTLAAG